MDGPSKLRVTGFLLALALLAVACATPGQTHAPTQPTLGGTPAPIVPSSPGTSDGDDDDDDDQSPDASDDDDDDDDDD